MKKYLLTLPLLFVLTACAPREIAIDWKTVNDNTARTYFDAGVQSAIRARLNYAMSELNAGRTPSYAGQDATMWASDAKKFWLTVNTNDTFLGTPAAK